MRLTSFGFASRIGWRLADEHKPIGHEITYQKTSRLMLRNIPVHALALNVILDGGGGGFGGGGCTCTLTVPLTCGSFGGDVQS